MTAPAQLQSALALLLSTLASAGYRFITPTPLTQQRVLSRACRNPPSLQAQWRDIFGWSCAFKSAALPAELLAQLLSAGLVVADAGPADDRASAALWLKSTVRVSSIGDDLFVHSAFPTTESDAVFFGPDTYRFTRFISQSLPATLATPGQPSRVLDMGCSSGAGAVMVARVLGTACEVVLNDINPKALDFAALNLAAAGLAATLLPGDGTTQVEGLFEVIVANPPYLDDALQRAYRHGGARLGRDMGMRMAAAAVQRLAPGGCLLLYTGVAMVQGQDPFLQELAAMLAGFDGAWTYSEIDPDVFGEELDRPVYAQTDRIAAVGLTVHRRQTS